MERDNGMRGLFGNVFVGLFGSVSTGRLPPTQPPLDQMQRTQDVFSLANELKVTPEVASTIIQGRSLLAKLHEKG